MKYPVIMYREIQFVYLQFTNSIPLHILDITYKTATL